MNKGQLVIYTAGFFWSATGIYIRTNPIYYLYELIHSTEQILTKNKNYINRNDLLVNSKISQYIFEGTRAVIPRIPDNTKISVEDASIQSSEC